MSSERNKTSENPYESPDVALIERRSGPLSWWLRPGGTPSILAALPFVIVLVIGTVVAVVLPIIQWLWR